MKIFTESEYAGVCNLYKEGLSVPAVSERLNLSRSTVYGIVRRNNIARPISEALSNCWKLGRIKNRWTGKFERSYFYNESFFDTDSAEMSWVLGLIFSDGHVGKNNWHISIEKDICEKVKKIMNGGKISRIKGIWNLNVCSLKMCNMLRKRFGLESKKSKTLRLVELPDFFMRHFIRGFWDGDGWIGTITRKGRRLDKRPKITFEAAITLASGDFLKSLLLYLHEKGVVKGGSISYYKDRKNSLANTPVWLLRLYQSDTVSLCRWLYSDVDESICGEKNYEKAKSFINEISNLCIVG